VRLKELLRKIRPDPKPLEGEGERPVDNLDAWASGAAVRGADQLGAAVPATYPPNYVPPVDEGRPRH
jgi:hypothetical protein